MLKKLAELAQYKFNIAHHRAKNLSLWFDNFGTINRGNSGNLSGRKSSPVLPLLQEEDTSLAICVRIISGSLAWLPLEVLEVGKDKDGKRVEEVDSDHAFNDLWKEPNEYHTTSEINNNIVGSLLTAGNAFTTINTGPGKRIGSAETVQELWPENPSKFSLKLDKDNKPLHYTQVVKFEEIKWELEQLIHHRIYNVNDTRYGRTLLAPMKRSISTDYLAELFNQAFFNSDGTPRQIFSPTADMGIEQRRMFEETYDTKANPRDKNRLQVLPVSGTIHSVTPSQTDMEFIQMRRFHRERMFGLIGIPPFLGGVMEFANYANAMIQEASYWRHTMIPILSLIADFITRHLLWRYYDKDHVVRYDLSDVEALQQDQIKKSIKNKNLIVTGVFTPNEIRAREYNELPHPDGDTLYQPATAVPAGDQGSDPAVDGDTDKTVTVTTRDSDNVVLSRKEVPIRVFRNQIKSFDTMVAKNEPRIEKAVIKYWKGQEKRVLDALEKHTVEGVRMSNLLPVISGKGHLDFFTDLKFEDDLLIAQFTPLYYDIVGDVGEDTLNDIRSIVATGAGPQDIEIAFNVRNPNVVGQTENLINRSTIINDTTFDEIRKILRTGFNEGLPIDDVAKMIRDKFSEFSKARARMVAQTEMNSIANMATEESWKQNGATAKTWIATLDPKTRDFHVMYHGERVAINDFYLAGPEPMMRPGDKDAQLASNVINCRCSQIYDFDPVESGSPL